MRPLTLLGIKSFIFVIHASQIAHFEGNTLPDALVTVSSQPNGSNRAVLRSAVPAGRHIGLQKASRRRKNLNKSYFIDKL